MGFIPASSPSGGLEDLQGALLTRVFRDKVARFTYPLAMSSQA